MSFSRSTPASASACAVLPQFNPEPYPNSCLAPVYNVNGSNIGTQVFQYCCEQGGSQIAFNSGPGFQGTLNATDPVCYVYCNATSSVAATLLQMCVSDNGRNLTSWSCQENPSNSSSTMTLPVETSYPLPASFSFSESLSTTGPSMSSMNPTSVTGSSTSATPSSAAGKNLPSCLRMFVGVLLAGTVAKSSWG